MKSVSGPILGLTLLAGASDRSRARAPRMRRRRAARFRTICWPAKAPLAKVAEAVKDGHSLNILVVGSRSSTISSVGSQRLSGAAAGRAEGKAAVGRG